MLLYAAAGLEWAWARGPKYTVALLSSSHDQAMAATSVSPMSPNRLAVRDEFISRILLLLVVVYSFPSHPPAFLPSHLLSFTFLPSLLL